MIFKIQLPLVTNEPSPQALIYNEDRSIEFFFPIADELVSFMGGEPKMFVHAEINEIGDEAIFDIQGEAPWQDW